ncbi:hypothetical protein mRhiFer1_008619 [Rhinolophus ferrumequinum]|uniref:Uncharacterized protein n=1 Tax=Rhinolophus ferrumequinum TaxID=59479 RepID=A0A7J7U105_RHIFE|nr:hypothetical protein mRhiFer1_008619 [Rhinolophus ferrumequinum]
MLKISYSYCPFPLAVIPACSTPTLQINLGERMHVQALQLSSRAFMSSAYMAMVSKQLGAFMFGGIARFSLTSMATKITNHLSPHFLAMCLPHLASSFNCESSYVTNYTCTRHPEDILDARE